MKTLLILIIPLFVISSAQATTITITGGEVTFEGMLISTATVHWHFVGQDFEGAGGQ